MPEGDTIHRTAQALDRALAGKELRRIEAPRLRFAPFTPATVVDGAEAAGKHCLVRFDDGRVLHTHLGMTGSWHLYRPGERWRKRPAAMRALVEVADWVAVCFAAPVVELTDTPSIEHLGPDLCRPEPDLEEALRRLAARRPVDAPIGEALLDQRVATGIGNIHKNEACFTCRVDPFTPVAAVDETLRRRLLETAARQLRAGVGAGRIFEGGRPAVYGRRGQPCRRCGTTIEWAAQGAQRRGTYWCPACQPPGGGNAAG